MRKVWAVLKRELIAYYSSPIAYIVITAFLLLNGYIFTLIISYLNDPFTQAMAPLRLFFGGTIFFWIFMLFLVPVITMRLIAEERRSGTIEVLLTSPVTEGQIVLGKFLAAYVFYVSLWIPTLIYVFILTHYTQIDWGPVVSGYLGVLLIGILFMGVGTFTSILTKNQIIAAILAFTAMVILFSVGLLEELTLGASPLRSILSYMNLWEHMQDYGRGIVDTRHVIYEVSMGMGFLYLATKTLESRKWR